MDSISLPVTTGSSYYGNKYFLHDSEGLEIISTPELGYTEDVLEEIALAINAHDDLLAVCVKMANDERFYKNDYSHFTCLACGNTGNKPLLIRHTEWCLIGEGHAAIAKAKGDQCTA